MSHDKSAFECFGFIAFLWLAFIPIIPSALGQSDILFDAQRSQFRGSGWTFGAGAHWLRASPQESLSVLTVVNEIGQIDTLHSGHWNHQGSIGPRLGIGYWHVVKRPILWDRISVQLEGGRHRAESLFIGNVADSTNALIADTLTDLSASGMVSELTLRLHRAIELRPDFFLEAQMGLGWDAEWSRTFNRSGPSHRFVRRQTPTNHRLALELGLGFGVRTRAGRYLRIIAQTDALQLSPFAADGGGLIDRYEGKFRSAHITLNWDFLRRKPDISCAGKNLGNEAMPLFEPAMQRKINKRRRKG